MPNLTVPNFLDIFLVVILLATAFKYRKKGFATAMVELAGTTIASISAFIFATKAAPGIFDRFFKSAFAEQVSKKFASTANAMLTSDVAKEILSFLPDGVVDTFLASDGALSSIINPNSPDAANRFVEEIIAPIITPLLSVIMFFIVLVVAKLLISFFASVLQKINILPGVGTVNKWLGFAAGIIVGFVNLYVIVVALSAIATLTGNQLPVLQTEFIGQSFFGRIFQAFNPFQW